MSKYIKTNREHWNELTEIHKVSRHYNLDGFKKGESTLRKLEIEEVGKVEGKSLLHLLCHFGMDTLSWARLGAKVTGIDIADASIQSARDLAKELHIDAGFIRSDVYDLPKILKKKFDIIYTSGGVLCWLSDLDKWAQIIHKFLKPGGIFYIREEHPFCNMYDYDFQLKTKYYFRTNKPRHEAPHGSYANRRAKVQTSSYQWHHTMSEIINSLIKAGLQIEFFHEYPFLSYGRFTGRMKQGGDRWYTFRDRNIEIPLTFSIKARKK